MHRESIRNVLSTIQNPDTQHYPQEIEKQIKEKKGKLDPVESLPEARHVKSSIHKMDMVSSKLPCCAYKLSFKVASLPTQSLHACG